jgi:hypothetical protein
MQSLLAVVVLELHEQLVAVEAVVLVVILLVGLMLQLL